MANLDFPRGFSPIHGEMSTEEYPIATANPQIGEGDLLERRADGFIYPAQVGTLTPIGVSAENKPANSGGTVKVYDNPNIIYTAQVSDAGVSAQTDFDLNYNIIASAPNSITGRSTMEIDGASKAATASLPIKILRIASVITPQGNSLGANVLLECIINNHLLKSTGVVG